MTRREHKRAGGGASSGRRTPRAAGVLFEALEARALLSALPMAEPFAQPLASVTNTIPVGYTPAQVRQGYGFTGVSGNGGGQTIAIVDAYDDPNIAGDLHAFDQQFGLPDPVFQVQKMSASINVDSGWALEIALDVEWAHAIAPGAKILLVEAKSNSMADLMGAVDWARNQPDVTTISMSWGGSEFSGETAYDSYFTTPSTHAGGITFLAASGDAGSPASYPSSSPNVVSVGGTTLSLSGSGGYQGETGWSYTATRRGKTTFYSGGASGGGISQYESKPAYQAGVTQSTSKRTTPDVAYDANPDTGFPVYSTVAYQQQTGWFEIGGTSAGAPQWAALVAIADQGRVLAGKGTLDGKAQTLPAIYAMSSADFHDITSGYNGYNAGPGYDLVTGRGSPVANLVIADLIATTLTAPAITQTTGGSSGNTNAPPIHHHASFASVSDQDLSIYPPGLKKAANAWERAFDQANVRLVEVA